MMGIKMKTFITGITLMLAVSPIFAGEPKVYTNEDLERYEKETTANEEHPISTIEEEQLRKRVRQLENQEIEQKKQKHSESSRELNEPQDNLLSHDCKVINFNTYEKSYAYVPPYGGISPLVRKQCVVVTLQNDYGLLRWVKHFDIIAIFVNNTVEFARLMPNANDTLETFILNGDTYTGHACFNGMDMIRGLYCRANKY